MDTLYQREYDERLNLHGTTRERSGRPLQVLPMKNQRIHGLYRGTESSAVNFIGRNAGKDWSRFRTTGPAQQRVVLLPYDEVQTMHHNPNFRFKNTLVYTLYTYIYIYIQIPGT